MMESNRRQEIIEVALSYAFSNIDDIAEAYEDSTVECGGGRAMWHVQGRYIAPVSEDEVQVVLDELHEHDGIKLVPDGD